MHIERILRVADAIETHSIPWLGFHMGSWYADDQVDQSGHNCGTVACIAGWTNALMLDPEYMRLKLGVRRMEGVSADQVEINQDDIRDWLGIDRATAYRLFYAESFPGNNNDITSAIAVRTLRHLAATGIVDWTIEPRSGLTINVHVNGRAQQVSDVAMAT